MTRLLKQPEKLYDVSCVGTKWNGRTIWTVCASFPRFILAELTRHRCFSFSVASSRAIPTTSLLRSELVYPIEWGKNKPGMSASEQIDEPVAAGMAWRAAYENATASVFELSRLGVHKQVTNRLLEPFLPSVAIITGTTEAFIPNGDDTKVSDLSLFKRIRPWDSFFALRDHPDAQPEIRHLAQRIREEMARTAVEENDKHNPRFYNYDKVGKTSPWEWGDAEMCYAAQMARVSFARNTEQRSPDADLAQAQKLLANNHVSPFEHIAEAADGGYANLGGWQSLRSKLT